MFDFFEQANELWRKGIPFATAVVVRTEKPTSAKPGDKAIITAQGELHGWVGGMCARPTVIKEALKALADGEHRFIRLSDMSDPSPRDGLLDMPMTCLSNGALEIYIEPQHPALRLMVVGNTPVARKLSELGATMDYHVVSVDLDSSGETFTGAEETLTSIDDIEAHTTPLTYIVVATHGEYDELALEKALRSNAAYIALVSSSKRAEAAKEYLTAQGISAEQFARLKYPAGLDIKAQTNDEIALSIIAEIIQKRREPKQINVDDLLEEVAQIEPAAEAIDPVCGMSVDIASAKYISEYKGETFYFCAASCKSSFDQNPEQYLDAPPSGEAIDPVCGMTVGIASAKYMSEYNGELYYFCAAGCKASFDKNPAQYLDAPPSGEAIDPVCGMTVDIASAKYMSEYQGEFYYFCAPGCKASFDKNPEKYVEVTAG